MADYSAVWAYSTFCIACNCYSCMCGAPHSPHAGKQVGVDLCGSRGVTGGISGICRESGHEEAYAGILESSYANFNVVSSEYTDLQIVLDSGAADHVINPSEAPGYAIKEGVASKAGGCFVAANGEAIANQGELNLELKAGETPINSTFQAAEITKPLWSVSKICQAGYKITFDSQGAVIYHVDSGAAVGKFAFKNGLYVGDMKLKNPAFTRQGGR